MRTNLLVMTLALFGSGLPASAHHGFAVEFDDSKCTNMKGAPDVVAGSCR